MVNVYRGEVELSVEGEVRIMRLTLGALAELEARLESQSLLDMIARFEGADFRARDLVSLLTAGLNGGGWKITEAEMMSHRIDGGPIAAAKAAARLLRVTFGLPGEETE